MSDTPHASQWYVSDRVDRPLVSGLRLLTRRLNWLDRIRAAVIVADLAAQRFGTGRIGAQGLREAWAWVARRPAPESPIWYVNDTYALLRDVRAESRSLPSEQRRTAMLIGYALATILAAEDAAHAAVQGRPPEDVTARVGGYLDLALDLGEEIAADAAWEDWESDVARALRAQSVGTDAPRTTGSRRPPFVDRTNHSSLPVLPGAVDARDVAGAEEIWTHFLRTRGS